MVNPLGGTMVADASAFGGFAGAPHQPAPPAPTGGYDAPPAGFGAPPPGFGAPPTGFEATSPIGDDRPLPIPQTAAMGMQSAPITPYQESLPPIPGTVGGANPIVTVLLIVFTCGIYGIYLLIKGKKASS